jgi:dTDP-4-dehydrorhamnose reductase
MAGQRVLVIGAAGQLGRHLVTQFAGAGFDVVGLTHADLDLESDDIGEHVLRLEPRVVINSAAWTDVDGCARDPDRAMLINGVAPGRLAAASAKIGATFVQVSTNEVFDGSGAYPYGEDDQPNPINPYGASKLAGERGVAAATDDHLIVRTAWIFGPGNSNFPSKILGAALRSIANHAPLRVVADEWGNPSWAPGLAAGIRRAVELGARSALHVAGEPPTTRYEWASVMLDDLPGLRMEPITAAEYPRPAPVPPRAILSTAQAASLGLPRLSWESESRTLTAGLLAEART